jgi:methylglutamate dehydrogenase subunit D
VANGINITEQTGFGLATVMARKGVTTAQISAALGLELVTTSGWAGANGLSAVGTGPGTWLVRSENASHGWAAGLANRLLGLASVSDQSGGYAIWRINGPNARDLLQRGAYIDLHPSCFGPGSSATTVIAHIGVILWQADDAPTYDVAIFRSFSHSFQHWITVTIASL